MPQVSYLYVPITSRSAPFPFFKAGKEFKEKVSEQGIGLIKLLRNIQIFLGRIQIKGFPLPEPGGHLVKSIL